MPDELDSKSSILDAAEALFARQGFDSTSIKEIATEAGVNSALLYYYFGDKEQLYHQVLSRRIEAFVAESMRALAGARGPEDTLRTLIDFQTRILREQPTLPRLLVRELLDHDASHARAQIAHIAANTFRRLRETIAAGQREGIFRADVDPRFAAISCVSQVIYFHIAQPAVRILLDAEGPSAAAGSDDITTAFAAHATQFALAALRSPTDAVYDATGSP